MADARSWLFLVVLLSASLLTRAQVENQPATQPQIPPVDSPSPPSPPDSTRLEVIKARKPDYPAQAAEKELQGQVWIKLLISETGDVETAEIISGDPVLAKAAADAMKKWKFKPFIKNGRAVKVSTKMPFDFAFKSRVSDPHPSADAGMPASPASPSAAPALDGASATPSETDGPLKILRISQGVMKGNIVHRVEPVYPPEARRNHIQGTVLLQATIGKDGRLHDVKPLSGPPELIEASIGAIQQWRYRPYLLKGNPVEVQTTIKVQFHM